MHQRTYIITVEGEFDEVTCSAFADLDVQCAGGNTVLHTPPSDQAALDGVLDRLRLVGATLLELRRTELTGR